MEQFKITRIFADQNGESHFEDVYIPLESNGDIGFVSIAQKIGNIIFRKVKPDYNYEFHLAPARQYIVLLDGGIKIETSTGENRVFVAGEILLVEDTWGKGHNTKNLKEEVRSSVFITL